MKLFGFPLSTITTVLLTMLIGIIALGLDLASDGLVDRLLWNITGETEPLPQLLGGAQYLANYTRQTPELAEDAQIQHIPDNPFGINAFLELEAEASRREQSMQLIADAGFGWLRQQFPWEDIEIDGKGDFVDRRSDRTADGLVTEEDFISSWDKYDHIVELAGQYDVEIIARLGGPTPPWALAPGVTNTHSPPANVQDFVDFSVITAERYKGRIHYYQVWNEPNLYPEWGDQNINPAAYVDMLCRVHDALKAVDPNIVILTGAIGPTIDLSGRNAYDVLFLQKLYDAGGGACFDILTAQGYGLHSGPTDRRLRPFTVNYGRNQWLRDVMVKNGDAHKPIWLSEAAWNPVPDEPSIADLTLYGQVTPEQAAEWAPLAYERAIEEWEWVGVVNWWFLKRPNPDEVGQSFYYFRIVEPDWTLTPTYFALQDYIQSGEWREDEPGWDERSRELVPWVLTLGLAVLFSGTMLASAITKRLFGDRS
ncbi:MAG: hypothetical protein L0154_14075 [Chloroflexi bacterium]|nr:hypothetical protein [Chloroflexota bacterium]